MLQVRAGERERGAARGGRSARSRGAGAWSERRAEPAASSSPPSPGAGSAPPHAATSLSAIGCKGGAETGGLRARGGGSGGAAEERALPEPVTQVGLAAACFSPPGPRVLGTARPWWGEGRAAAASSLPRGLQAAPEAELQRTKRT